MAIGLSCDESTRPEIFTKANALDLKVQTAAPFRGGHLASPVTEKTGSAAMAVRMGEIAYDEDPDALYRGRPPRVPRVRAIAPTARLLAPTVASLAAARDKAPTRADRERAERREEARRRLRLARVAKANGRLTVPQSPKFRDHPRARASAGPQLTMTSRELEEIRALRRRVVAERRKTQRYHEATTRAFPVAAAAPSAENASFAKVRLLGTVLE